MIDAADDRETAASRWRRLIAALVTLAIVDLFVPGWLAKAERLRYDGADVFRFEYSDLFGIGPAVDYLREHPNGARPRAVFLGNSVVWGYRLRVEDSLPVQFQRLEPSMHVLNFAVNGFGVGSAMLMAKDIVDAIDILYVHAEGGAVNPELARLIPVSDDDVARFQLLPPDRTERRFEDALGFWRLYRLSYRLQAALFGTSTRNYAYTHKSALVGGAGSGQPVSLAPDRPISTPGALVTTMLVVSAAEPDGERLRAIEAAEPALWECARFVQAHGKRAVFWSVASPASPDRKTTWADLNRVFQGSSVFVELAVPPEMMIDERHFSASGSAAVARALRAVTASAFAAPR